MEQEMLWDYRLTSQCAEVLSQNLDFEQSHPTESDLVHAAQRGDLAAFNGLVLAYQDSLFRWVMSLVHDEELADDITQRTFVTAFEKLSAFRGGSMRAWLFRIARNRSFDEIRYHKRHPSIPLDADAKNEEARDLLSILYSDAPSPEEEVIQTERDRCLLELLKTLPEPFQEVLQLVDLNQMEYQEAAEVLGLPLGTLKSRVARARLRLHEQIVQNCDLL